MVVAVVGGTSPFVPAVHHSRDLSNLSAWNLSFLEPVGMSTIKGVALVVCSLGWGARTRGSCHGACHGKGWRCDHGEVKVAFQRLGIAHLLAVSGYHVGLVSSLFLLLLTTQHRWLKRLSALGVMAAGLFVVACRSPISGVRSWAMMAWVWTAMVRGRRGLGWEALGMVAMAVAILSHTSFLATASLMALKGRRLALRVSCFIPCP